MKLCINCGKEIKLRDTWYHVYHGAVTCINSEEVATPINESDLKYWLAE